MIHSVSGNRVLVCVDLTYGPYFEIVADAEPLWLEAILQGRFYIPYWVVKKKSEETPTKLAYHFGAAADPEKLQKILDMIDFERKSIFQGGGIVLRWPGKC